MGAAVPSVRSGVHAFFSFAPAFSFGSAGMVTDALLGPAAGAGDARIPMRDDVAVGEVQ
jgi:hypothetical protein